ncbi:helix-turn-helix transcriptional regulator [Streptomyces abikoensis]|uniref:LuxR C-terminal-related transcriptional regulator n=1 Tax=Streptomyces abikoensis TaxID=97398 RepID=A0ABW7SX70_9ACTN
MSRPAPDARGILRWLGILGRRTGRELRLALSLQPFELLVRHHVETLCAELIEHGVGVRALCAVDSGGVPAYTAHVRHLMSVGVRVREVPAVPLWMAVVDNDAAMVPGDAARGESEPVLLRGAAPVAAYSVLFEQLWAQGDVSTGMAVPHEQQALSERERTVLSLLAEGMTDDGISRRTGLSIRTSRRTIAKLMSELSARSRFQAGAEAARRQWI